jgi:hypothetical protein
MASLFLVVDEMGPPGVSISNRAALDDDDGTTIDDGPVSYMGGGGEEGRSTSKIMPP